MYVCRSVPVPAKNGNDNGHDAYMYVRTYLMYIRMYRTSKVKVLMQSIRSTVYGVRRD